MTVPRCQLAKVAILLASVIAILPVVGCSGPPLGGKRVRINLVSQPQGLTAYLVPVRVWNESGGLSMLDSTEKISRYRVKESRTPILERPTLKRRYIYLVVSSEGNAEFNEIAVTDDGDQFQLNLEER